MILFGILISSKISEYKMDKNEIYNKAVKIESQEMFRYKTIMEFYGSLLGMESTGSTVMTSKDVYKRQAVNDGTKIFIIQSADEWSEFIAANSKAVFKDKFFDATIFVTNIERFEKV